MAEERAILVGDRVVHLQVQGIFIVVGRRGPLLDIENDRGVRMTLHEVALRRVDGTAAVPKDA